MEMTDVCGKFSREFHRKSRGEWRFTGSKPRNSRENFSCRPKVFGSPKESSRDSTCWLILFICDISRSLSIQFSSFLPIFV